MMWQDQLARSRIADLGRIVTGRTPATEIKEYFGNEYLFVTPSDMDGQKFIRTTERQLSPSGAVLLKNNRVPAGSIAVSCIGWQMGKVAIIAEEAYTNQQINTIVPNGCVIPDYLYYVLCTRREELKNLGSVGTRTPILNKSRFGNLMVTLPPLPIQRKIAAILSAYDDLIENNTRRIALLQAMAQALYREWFVHFRFPGHQSVPLVDSPLGPIPEGWRMVKLGDVAELSYGKALTSDERHPGEVPVFGSSGIVGYHDAHLVDGPGIIVGRKGNVGSVFWSEDPFYPIDTVYFVRTALPLHYVFFNLREQGFINNDAAVPGLNRNQAYSLTFLIPSAVALAQFEDFMTSTFIEVKRLTQTNANLRQTRDLLLPKLVSGELDVAEMEVAMGE